MTSRPSRASDTEQGWVDFSQSLLNESFVVAYIKSEDGRYEFVSKRYADILGRKPTECLGKTDLELWPAETTDQLVTEDKETLSAGSTMEFVEEIPRPDGRPQYWQVSKFPIVDASGRTHIGGVAVDMTDHKRAEDKVARLTRMYSVLSAVNQTIVRFRQPEETFKETCRILVEKGGFLMAWIGMVDPDTHLVKPVAHQGFEDGYLDGMVISVDDIPEGRGPTGTSIRERRPVISNDIERDQAMRPWRTKAVVRGYRSSASFPLRNTTDIVGSLNVYSGDRDFFDDEKVQLLNELCLDLSHAMEFAEAENRRRQTEEALHIASAYNRGLIEASLDPLVTIGPDGKITDANSATEIITGLTRGRLIGTDFANYFTDPNRARMGYERVFRDGFVHDYELELKDKNGRTTPVLYNASVYRDDKGSVVGVFAAARDITERKKAEEELRGYSEHLEEIVEERTKELGEAERMAAIGQTTLWIGHDLRNPLQVLMNAIYQARHLLKDTSPDSLEPARNEGLRLVSAVEEQVRYMDKIVTDLRDYASPIKVEPLETEIRPLIAEALSLVGPSDSINVSVEVEEDVSKAMVDQAILRRILANLVRNACEAMPKGGRLTIRANRKDSNASIVLEDTGAGISEENMEKLFTPFYTTKAKGQGLGLPVCRKLVEAHGGEITVESKLGQGTKVTVAIPLYPKPTGKSQAVPSS